MKKYLLKNADFSSLLWDFLYFFCRLNGQITIYSFVSGFAPFKTILTEGVSGFEIEMMKDKGGKDIIVVIDTLTDSAAKPGWVDIGGTVEDSGGIPLCALALANGQRMFTCGNSLCIKMLIYSHWKACSRLTLPPDWSINDYKWSPAC